MDSHSSLTVLEQPDLKSMVVSESLFEVDANRNIIDDIEVIPAVMSFVDAYEGKEFCKRLTLKNIGNKSAFVRIGAPTAKTFRLLPMASVCRLSPGLSLSRLIRMKYSRAFAVHDAQIPIYINNTMIEYILTISLNQAKIVVRPTEVNFGRIDAVSSVVAKTVVVTNEGTKTTAFSIDLGRNELELIVEPTKGILEASESVTFKLEVMGFYEGPFEKEFWIKTAPPKRVKVTGEFITPKLMATYPKTYADFSMVIFPRLYLGQKTTKTLMIKNVSSRDVMFCIKGMEENKYALYKEAAESNHNYKSFQIQPLEGRLASQQTTVIEITFEPVDSPENHAVCFIQVIRVDCTDVDESVVIRVNTCCDSVPMGTSDRSRNSLMTIASNMPRAGADDDFDELEGKENLVTEEKLHACESFRVCLYGDKEKARAKIRPQSISLNQIQVEDNYYREIFVENCSSYLPITISYQKVAFIDIFPNRIYLKPKEAKEILLKIKTAKAGYHKKKVVFDLLIYEIGYSQKKNKIVVGHIDMSISFTGTLTKKVPPPKFVTTITPFNHNEVGFMTHDIQFNSEVDQLKMATIRADKHIFRESDSDLIAYPNDRAQSLRPWKEEKCCKTIFAKIPRKSVSHDDYSYAPPVLMMRAANKNYYEQYLRKRAKSGVHKNKETQNNEVAKKLMIERFFCEFIEEKKIKDPISKFVALTPIMLHNVKIHPKYIRLQRVAPVSNVEHQFSILNDNDFPVFLYFTSVKPGIYFSQGDTKIINPHEEKIMTLTCFAGLVGRYINLIQVIVNFCHLYTISVMVEVVPKMINLDENVINFEPDVSGNIKYIQLQNHLNSSISFSTDMSLSRFKIQPSSGTILQKRSLLCAIRYENLPELPDYCELVLTSEGGGAQIMQMSRKKEKPIIQVFPPRFNLPNLPFNIKTTHSLRITNTMNYDICFVIGNPAPIPGVEIYPYEGVIKGLAEVVLKVTIIVDDTENLDTKFEFIFEDHFPLTVNVQGQVILPSVDIRPETIVNRQLIPSAYRRNIFYVKNESTCDCLVRFDLDQYEYFRVTEQEDDFDTTIHNTNLKLLPGEVKMLYLHFNPMDALTESFYMPVIINDKIGPPTLSNIESTNFALGESKSSTEIRLPCLKITSICSTISLHFSTLKLSFKYALSDVGTDQLTKFFTAKNLGSDQIEFCIRMDKVTSAFSLDYHSGTQTEEIFCSLVCTLNPGESTIFVVQFKPSIPGNYVNNVPIYVRNYLDGCIFNYLKLVGTYQEPCITTDRNTYYLTCTVVGFRSAVMLNLNLRYHHDNCQVSFDQPSEDVAITFRERAGRASRHTIKTKITVKCLKPTSIFTDINFQCTCGADCSIKLIASSDSCFLSHYSFFTNHRALLREFLVLPAKNFETKKVVQLQPPEEVQHVTDEKPADTLSFGKYIDLNEYPAHPNTLNYPFFPLVEDTENDDEYQYKMRDTVKFVERWISSQGFYKTKFYQIPFTIALAPIVKNSPSREIYIEPTILTFLVELGGIQVREACITSKVNSLSSKNIALHFLKTYSNILNYLESLGALLPHILPELLLTYEYYQIICTYCPHLLKLRDIFDEQTFWCYSTRCYLDVILQSIKIFILNCINMFDIEIEVPSSEEGEFQEERLSASSVATPVPCQLNVVKPNSYIYSDNEHILLYWLQYHFENQSSKLWKKYSNSTNTLKAKEMRIFEDDLNDSLVFACVTVAYCPYLTYAMTDMYVPPHSFEEYHHNACTIIKAWALLKLSYLVEPCDIVNPNGINMFLLTLYLYEILPSFFPRELVNLEAKLTQISKAKLNICNVSEHDVVYAVSFFSNEAGSFSSEAELFRIKPKKTGTLQIKYQAKKIASQKAVLILSGECPGQKYGRSKAIDLNGVTDLNYSITRVEFKCECYKIERMKVKLQSPYDVPDTYEVFYAILSQEDEAESLNAMALYSWKEYVLAKVPKRMYTREYEFPITDPAEGFVFQPIICCQMIPVRIYKMFMVGKHGDWCFDVKIIPKMSKQNHEVINVSLPRGFNSQACSCRVKSTEIPLICPRTIHIHIPSKNNLFYKSTREMFIACTDDQYLVFWKKYLPIRTVLHVLRSMYSGNIAMKTQGYTQFLESRHQFNISTEADTKFTAMKQLTIEDIYSEDCTSVRIHANPDFDPKAEVYLILTAISGYEKRYYKLNFYEA